MHAKLPTAVRKLAEKNYKLLESDIAHPSLNFKRVGKYWSARVGLEYRALAVKDGDDFV
jgi:hypothetical protein